MTAPARKKVAAKHRNAAVHGKIMAALSKMTPKQRRNLLVKAGVLTGIGKIASPYRKEPTLSYRVRAADAGETA